MEDYEIVGWPDIQYLMEREGFEDNAALINENESLGIGSSTYLVDKEWLESVTFNEKKKKGEILNKEFRVNEHFTISRCDYESFPCPMFAWKWTDEQMEELANRIDQKLCRYDENDPDGMEDDFWKTMEDEAVAMGMQYYEDLTEAEYESQKNEWGNLS